MARRKAAFRLSNVGFEAILPRPPKPTRVNGRHAGRVIVAAQCRGGRVCRRCPRCQSTHTVRASRETTRGPPGAGPERVSEIITTAQPRPLRMETISGCPLSLIGRLWKAIRKSKGTPAATAAPVVAAQLPLCQAGKKAPTSSAARISVAIDVGMANSVADLISCRPRGGGTRRRQPAVPAQCRCQSTSPGATGVPGCWRSS